MNRSYFKVFRLLLLFTLFVSCQNVRYEKEIAGQNNLSSDNGQLDLSLSTMEQQNIEKAQAEKFHLEVQQKRIVIDPQPITGLNKKSEINVALYGRLTSNKVGEQIYNRIKTKRKKTDPCRRFVAADDAQRFFLEHSGPQKDLWNLDPDGDGFACHWDPGLYRNLKIN